MSARPLRRLPPDGQGGIVRPLRVIARPRAMFKGSITALITPFSDGAVDERAFQSLIDRQIAEASDGIVPCGTTGELPTLSHAEHRRVTEMAVEVAERTRARHRGRRIELDRGGDRARAPRRTGRRRCRPRRHALLQQADAGRALSPFQGDPRRLGAAHHHLQHPAALGHRHERRNHGAPRGTAAHRRRQGLRPTISRARSGPSSPSSASSRCSRARTAQPSPIWLRAATAASR